MLRAYLSVFLWAAIATIDPGARQAPDLSGRWVAVAPPSAKSHELQISQDESVLTVIHVRPYAPLDLDSNRDSVFQLRETSSYWLDGRTTEVGRTVLPFHRDGSPALTRTLLTDTRVKSTLKREANAMRRSTRRGFSSRYV